MPITSEVFRSALRTFPSGVTIVTIKAGDQVHGLTISAFASVSPEPPLVTIMIDQRHRAYSLIETEGATFAVSILREDQIDLSNRFAWVKDEDRFAEGNWKESPFGVPVLTDALAWLDCSIYARYPAGTHTIYVGEVQASSVNDPDSSPLVYWNQGYRRLSQEEETSQGGRTQA
jgi:flavin reductase (DIM6/NTAB) family NADH-FMN oxidoreductase RutF